MVIKHFHGGKAYTIEVPSGSRVHRSEIARTTVVFVKDKEGEHMVADNPSCLLVALARDGVYGLRLVSEEVVKQATS